MYTCIVNIYLKNKHIKQIKLIRIGNGGCRIVEFSVDLFPLPFTNGSGGSIV